MKHDQKEKVNGVQQLFTRFGMLALLLIVGINNVGCSSPKVAYEASAPDDVAWWAYSDCMKTLSATDSPLLCENYNQSSNRSVGYNQYVTGSIMNTGYYATSTGDGSSQFRGFKATSTEGSGSGTEIGKTELDAAYRAYLSTLDADTLREMTEQWRAIAAERMAVQNQ